MQADKRLCDIQPQAASLCVTGAVSAHKPLHQFLRRNIERISADILHGKNHGILLFFDVDIHSRVRLRIFAGVAQKVAQHAPRQIAVPHGKQRGISAVDDRLQMGVFQLFLIFCNCLCRQLAHIRRGKLYLEVACRSLGGLNQVLGQLFQPAGLSVQNLNIFRRLSIQIFLFQQIHIVDDRGQRRFDIMGNICNQLRFQMLAFHFLL